jgi:ethanolamine ammonia-lyase large subunit
MKIDQGIIWPALQRHMAERVAAKQVLAHLKISDLRENPAVPYEDDEVTRIIQDGVNESIYTEIRNWSMAEFREWFLSDAATNESIRWVSPGLSPIPEFAAWLEKMGLWENGRLTSRAGDMSVFL